jgi:hypothetical protein
VLQDKGLTGGGGFGVEQADLHLELSYPALCRFGAFCARGAGAALCAAGGREGLRRKRLDEGHAEAVVKQPRTLPTW